MDGPFHAGELAAQARAGVTPPGMTGIRPFMPDQHREFFGLLPYLFVATVDETGWPVATVLTGEPGFVSSPDPTTLDVRALPRAGEPGAELFRAGRPFGALGLDFATRRRNRANGVIEAADARGLRLKVLQSFGNCPQYIQTRAVETAPASAVAAEAVAVDAPEVLAQITDADTFFVATVSGSAENGGVDISHRGGLPGFVKIVDGQSLTSTPATCCTCAAGSRSTGTRRPARPGPRACSASGGSGPRRPGGARRPCRCAGSSATSPP